MAPSRVWRFVLAMLVSMAACAEPAEPSTRVSLDLGLGHEAQTSPLFQISPESTVLYLPGLQRLQGSHARAQLQGFTDWRGDAGLTVSLSGDATFKRSGDTPDFDFMSLSMQPGVHVPLGRANLGAGVNLQRMDVAGQHFRDVRGLQASWALPDGPNLWAIIAETGTYRHSGQLADLDALASSLVLQRQIDHPWSGATGLALSMIWGRERNQRGLRELSHRNFLVGATLDGKLGDLFWTLRPTILRSTFDDSAFASEPARRDRTTLLDLTLEWPLTANQTLRLELNQVRNRSSTHLYDNRYQQVSVGLHIGL